VSSHLAIATVTAGVRVLAARAAEKVPGAQVTTMRPSLIAAENLTRGVNIFLYLVKPNPVLANEDLPNRRADGSVANVPHTALDLHYLVSFFGDEDKLEPHILLGAFAAQIRLQPLLTPALIQEAITASPQVAIGASDLAGQRPRVTVSMETLDLDTLSRLWSIFQTPYLLTVALRCNTVLIESEATVDPRPPVRKVDVAPKPEVT
jgi:hypothetical protein